MKKGKSKKLDPLLEILLKSTKDSMVSTSRMGYIKQDTYQEKIDTLDLWANVLQGYIACQQLFPELVADSFFTVFFSFSGLYKYANATLRSSLETALRIAYFAFHPVEYQWWKEEKNWQLDTKNVWGKGYEYFKRIEKIHEVEEKLSKANLPGLFDGQGYCIKRIYSELSKSVHTSYQNLYSGKNKYLPAFDSSAFEGWSKLYEKVMGRVNLLFFCVFNIEYTKMNPAERSKILDIGIASTKTKEILEL